MKLVILASLFAALPAAADPAPAARRLMPPMPSPVFACPAKGVPLLEIRNRSEIQAPTSTTKIYASGAWTFQPVDEHGRRGALVRGCFDRVTLKEIKRAVHRAPWRVTTSQIRCFAYSPQFTLYAVHGRVKFRSQMCSGQTADKRTLAAIGLVEDNLAAVMPQAK